MLTSTFTYDSAGQLVGASVPTAALVVQNYVYRYDRGGNRTSEQIDHAVIGGTYNNLNQLTATSPAGPIRFAGTVNEPSTVTVNGQPATVDSAGNFKADVTLAPGHHTVPPRRNRREH